jgi:hypothetical protein
MVSGLEATFPGLARSGYAITSPRGKRYNCIAWAAGDTANWWWPVPDTEEVHWPAGVVREETLAALQEAFASLGYVVCADEALEAGFEKVALFALADGFPTHAARQFEGGRWTSKLGELEDIEHALRDLEGTEYGSVALVMKRLLRTAVGP